MSPSRLSHSLPKAPPKGAASPLPGPVLWGTDRCGAQPWTPPPVEPGESSGARVWVFLTAVLWARSSPSPPPRLTCRTRASAPGVPAWLGLPGPSPGCSCCHPLTASSSGSGRPSLARGEVGASRRSGASTVRGGPARPGCRQTAAGLTPLPTYGVPRRAPVSSCVKRGQFSSPTGCPCGGPGLARVRGSRLGGRGLARRPSVTLSPLVAPRPRALLTLFSGCIWHIAGTQKWQLQN